MQIRHALLALGLCIVFAVPLQCYAMNNGIDLSSPEQTIKTFFESSNLEVIQECFYSGNYAGPVEKWWQSYRILSKKNTDKAGQMNYLGVEICPDAVELIVEVRIIDIQKNNPETKFWFLLQQFGNDWKIIEHYHIPDYAYPPLE